MQEAVQGTDIFSIAFSSISLITISILLCSFLYNEYNLQKYGFRFWRIGIEKLCAIFIWLFFLFYAIYVTITAIYSLRTTLNPSNNLFNAKWCILHWNEQSPWALAKFVVYQFFIIRLYHIFGGTMFEIPTNRLKAMAVIVCIPNLVYITISYYLLGMLSNQLLLSNPEITSIPECIIYFNDNVNSSIIQYLLYGLTLYLLNELIFSIIILRLFLKRIIFLSLTIQNDSKTTLVDKDLLHLAIKTTNLTILAFSTNIFQLLHQSGIAVSVLDNFDGILSSMAIFLAFKSSSKYYDKLFSCCHHLCYGYCIKCCFCCCSVNKLPDNIQLAIVERNDAKKQSEASKETVSTHSTVAVQID